MDQKPCCRGHFCHSHLCLLDDCCCCCWSFTNVIRWSKKSQRLSSTVVLQDLKVAELRHDFVTVEKNLRPSKQNPRNPRKKKTKKPRKKDSRVYHLLVQKYSEISPLAVCHNAPKGAFQNNRHFEAVFDVKGIDTRVKVVVARADAIIDLRIQRLNC